MPNQFHYSNAQRLSQLVQARLNCLAMNPINDYYMKHEEIIKDIIDNSMPHGSGIDGENSIDMDRSTDKVLYFNFSYHFMNEAGYYDGWEDYTLVVKPAFIGIDMRIQGKNRNDIKDYLYETFNNWLTAECDF
jgi:hypothetical protein